MKYLPDWRAVAGFATQSALADAAGVGQNQVSVWEDPDRNAVPGLENAAKLAEALSAQLGYKVSAQDLLSAPPPALVIAAAVRQRETAMGGAAV